MIFVSDHAVLRWLQRRHGLDIEAIRAAIAARVAPLASAAASVADDACGRVTWALKGEDVVLVIVSDRLDDVVITALAPGSIVTLRRGGDR